jgi:hypothetical protein
MPPEDKEKSKLAEFGKVEIQPTTPETAPEAGLEASWPAESGVRENSEVSAPAEAALPPPPPAQPSLSEIRYRQIESILEEDLADLFFRLDPQTQLEFKMEGEKTIQGIDKVLAQTKIRVKKIVDLIRHWLKLIPGINRHFLEQEAKIKTDKILALADKDRQKIV